MLLKITLINVLLLAIDITLFIYCCWSGILLFCARCRGCTSPRCGEALLPWVQSPFCHLRACCRAGVGCLPRGSALLGLLSPLYHQRTCHDTGVGCLPRGSTHLLSLVRRASGSMGSFGTIVHPRPATSYDRLLTPRVIAYLFHMWGKQLFSDGILHSSTNRPAMTLVLNPFPTVRLIS